MNKEVREYENLIKMGNCIYNEVDPYEIMFQGKIFEIEKSQEGGYNFLVNIPFINKEDLDLYQKGDELSIAIKNEKRNFILPQKLHSKEINGANYKNGKLIINFK